MRRSQAWQLVKLVKVRRHAEKSRFHGRFDDPNSKNPALYSRQRKIRRSSLPLLSL